MKQLIGMLLMLAIAGCVAEPRVYDTGISKHPCVLTLMHDSSYQLEYCFTEKAIEKGQWATALQDSEMEVVLLQPNSPDQKKQYAYLIDPEKNLISLWLHDDMRSIWINHIAGRNQPTNVSSLGQYER